MKLACLAVLLTIALSFGLTPKSVRPLEKPLRCRACHAVTKEIIQQIEIVGKAGSDKTFQVGHRMQKNQNWQKDDKRKRKYYGSEIMAMEVLEQVCPAMYPKGGQLLKKHLNTRNDLKEAEKRVSSSDADVTGTSLESYCGTLLEEYEEELKERIFEKNKGKWARWLCVDETGTCTEDEYLDIWAQDDEEDEDEL